MSSTFLIFMDKVLPSLFPFPGLRGCLADDVVDLNAKKEIR